MEIQKAHLTAVAAAKKELETSLGYYEPGSYKQNEIVRHVRNLTELQSVLETALKNSCFCDRNAKDRRP